ncbi:MAG: nuclear transport factor 2 family protein [Pseudomonadota bacterium]
MNEHLKRFIALMEALPNGIPASFDEVIGNNIHFLDPFNDLRGREHYRAVMADMIEKIDDLRIEIEAAAITSRPEERPARALVKWRLMGQLIELKHQPWDVSGCAEIAFDQEGRVIQHWDYWDAAGQLYERLPLVGILLRAIKRRIAL